MARKSLSLALAAIVITITATPALADGDVRCNSGSIEKWQKIDKLKKEIWLEGWSLQKLQVEGDCYEVYARTENGQAVEAFFHPVTLKKLVVFRRGQEIFRAKGFAG